MELSVDERAHLSPSHNANEPTPRGIQAIEMESQAMAITPKNEEVNLQPKRKSHEIKETVKPIRIVHYIINHPCKLIGIFLIIFIFVCIADSMVFEFSESSGREWFVNNSDDVHRYDAITLSIDDISNSAKYPADPKTQEINFLSIVTIFKTRDGSNILQPSTSDNRLSYISEINSKIINSNYPDYFKLCYADSTSFPNCSSTAVYDPLISSISSNGYNVSTITQSELDQVVNESISTLGAAYYANFEASFATDPARESQYYRAIFKFGLPYPDINETHSSYRSSQDNYHDQVKYYDDWVFPIWKDIQLKSNNDPNVEVVVSGQRVNNLAMNEIMNDGTAWSVASIIAVWLIMLWHMRSVFLATIAILQIVLGFPFSYFLYRIVFNITYFGFLHSLVIFIILGIAADDCFVFVDAWHQSEQVVEMPDNLIQRMSYTYRRASHAMAVTTFTTIIAFLATAFSPIMPISAFGIWAATVIFVNYMFMITYFPACLSWYHQYVRKCERCPRCCCCIKCSICGLFKKEEENDKEGVVVQKSVNDGEENNPMENDEGSRFIERFLRNTWSKWMIKAKYFILAFFTVLIGFSVWQTTQLEGLTEQEAFFDRDHYMEKMFWWMDDFYGGNINSLIRVKVAWGIEPRVDRSGTDPWDITDLGRSIYHDDFDLSPVNAQQYIYDICEELKTNHSDQLYSPSTELNCFIYDLIDYANTTNNLSFPFVYSSNNATIQKMKFNELISNWTHYTTQGKYYLNSGFVGYKGNTDELKFIIIEFPLQLFRWSKYDIKKAEYDYWETHIQEWNDNAPTGVADAFQASFAFAWMSSEKAFMTSAIQGVGIALPAAFVVLLLSTHNWIVSIFATLTIIGILLTEVMLIVLQGWQLGISESIAIVIMIGFSVDYVVHFASAYVECPYSQKRDSRIRFSLFTMGISIIGGAITTFASGFFLIFPEMIFFQKFSILIMSVVSLSLLYAMTFFIALLAAFGPNGDYGNLPLKRICGNIKKKLCSKGEQN